MNAPTERHKLVYLLRMSGRNYVQIADRMGVTRQRAQQLFLVAKQRIECHENVMPVGRLVDLDNAGRMDGLEPDLEAGFPVK